MSILFDTKEAAQYLGVSVSYLKKARIEVAPGGRTPGPEYIRLPCTGKSKKDEHTVRYHKESLDVWLKNLKRYRVTAEEGIR